MQFSRRAYLPMFVEAPPMKPPVRACLLVGLPLAVLLAAPDVVWGQRLGGRGGVGGISGARPGTFSGAMPGPGSITGTITGRPGTVTGSITGTITGTVTGRPGTFTGVPGGVIGGPGMGGG